MWLIFEPILLSAALSQFTTELSGDLSVRYIMCGIWAVFGLKCGLDQHCGSTFKQISPRGPDAWRIEYDKRLKNCCIGFHRLTIVDCTYGMQPMQLRQYPLNLLICNGELYNCKRLNGEFGFTYETRCDVECILHLYKKFGIDGCTKRLDGVFAFCIIDLENKKLVMARDPYGVRPLFRLQAEGGILAVCSEAKGLIPIMEQLKNEKASVAPFPPGTYAEYDILDDGTVKLSFEDRFHVPGDKPVFTPAISNSDLISDDHLGNIRKLFTAAVRKRLMADRRIGCLLSGGLDSSLTASLLVDVAKEENMPYKIQTFAIGMEDSPDLKAAKKVADHIGTEHYEIIFTEKDVEEAIDEVIRILETPDITTIRASIGMLLISKYIKKHTNTTVLFSGEGADELAQGYIYFKKAPNAEAAYQDSIRLLSEIYLFDGLRADRTVSSQGLELRLPFLDIQFTHYYLSMPKEMLQPKNGTQEKYMLRAAFAGTNALPDEILWRHKEAFSDGVTSRKKSLFQYVQEIIDQRLPGKFDAAEAQAKYPHCPPKTKESLYYREKFEQHYAGCAKNFIPHYWMPRWCEEASDPSARFIKHYEADAQVNGNGVQVAA